jgi:hypothetical protein
MEEAQKGKKRKHGGGNPSRDRIASAALPHARGAVGSLDCTQPVPATEPTPESVQEGIAGLLLRLRVAQEPILRDLQAFLDELEGKSFGSFEANQRVASLIQAILSRLRCSVMCPKEGCGRPSKLRCRKPRRSPEGSFQCEHDRTNHSFLALPRLKIISE